MFIFQTKSKRMRLLSVIYFCLLCFTQMHGQSNKDLRTVESILHRQAQDWNTGIIDNFMNGYWVSDELMFIGSKGVTRGWKQTLDNYKKSYPDKATMGELSFEVLENEKLSKKSIMMVGKFHLAREEKEDLSGHFILIWKKIKGKWVIIADHTS